MPSVTRCISSAPFVPQELGRSGPVSPMSVPIAIVTPCAIAFTMALACTSAIATSLAAA